MRAQMKIEFADRRAHLGWYAVLFVLSLVALAGAAIWHWQNARFELAEAKSKLERVLLNDRESGQRKLEAQLRMKEDPARILAINNAIAALNVPWAVTLKKIEQSKPKEVALLRLEPRVQERKIRVTAQALGSEPLFRFAKSLVDESVFPSLTPVKQERVEIEGRPGVKLTFDIEWVV